MQCFIVENGEERKAGLKDLLPIIEKDRECLQSIIRKTNPAVYRYLPAALVRLPSEMKEKVYRNVSSRAGVILRKRASEAETEFEEELIQGSKAELIKLIGVYTKDSIEYPKHFIWRESPTALYNFIERVEEAFETGELNMSYYTYDITREEIQTVFQKRLNELPKIKCLKISRKDLPAAVLLFETGKIEKLEINGKFYGEWPQFLEKCQSLLELEFVFLEKSSVFPSWVHNASSLRSLSINYSYIDSLPDWIGDLESLTKLSLGNKNYDMETLPDSIGNLKNLVELEIKDSPVKKLPDSIGSLKNLQSLYLRDLPIEKLPDWIGDLQSLTTLWLPSNENLKTLPDSIGNLKNLDFLDLSYTPIEKLPDSLVNLKNLKTLFLHGSPIEKLPDWIGDLQSLTMLSLFRNENLKTLPDSIGNLKNLVTLDLGNSAIEKLPDTIVNCTALKSVDIVGTKLSSVPDSISSVTKSTKGLIELIPQEESVSYHCFCNSYYKLVEAILRFSDKAKRGGLLELEEDIELLADGFFRKGMRDIVNAQDADNIRSILSTRLEREHDLYRKKLMEVAMEGILRIQAGDTTVEIAFILASLVDIKNNLLDAACDKYLSGDIEAFSTIDFKAAILPEEEREEVRFIKRALKLHKIMQKEGLLALEKYLDQEAIASRDVFDYGLALTIDFWDGPVIDKIISNLIERETDPVRKQLAKAKDAAATAIYCNLSQRTLYEYFCAFFDKSITQDKGILKLVGD